ncbi:MAG: DPP IV N-terminal domain-containing protein, partial [Pyrinomonadaceae bacterium]
MNKNIFPKLAVVFSILVVSLTVATAQPRALTAADYARAEKMLAYNTAPLVSRAGVRPVWLADGRFYYSVATGEGNEFALVNPSDGTHTSGKDLAALGITTPATAAPVGRRNFNPDGVVSPDGKRIAYIKDYNLWMKDTATGKETQLTTDGVKDFGYATDNAGWVHSDRAILLWSPDSKKIATFQQDQRKTGDMYLVSTNVGHPTLEAWKYPLPGDKDITMIERVIIEVDNPKVIRLKMPPDEHRSTLCDDVSCDGGFTDNVWSA